MHGAIKHLEKVEKFLVSSARDGCRYDSLDPRFLAAPTIYIRSDRTYGRVTNCQYPWSIFFRGGWISIQLSKETRSSLELSVHAIREQRSEFRDL